MRSRGGPLTALSGSLLLRSSASGFAPLRDIPDRSRGGPIVCIADFRRSSVERHVELPEFVISQVERPGISPGPSWPTSDLLRPGSCLAELPAISLQ